MKQNIHVILIEDDPIDQIKIKIMFTEFNSVKYDFNLMQVFDNIDSLLLFLEDNHQIDMIISDMFTQNRSTGIELLKKLKTTDTPIVIITNSQDKLLYKEAQLHQNGSYLIKPFHYLTLQSTMENLLFNTSLNSNSEMLNKRKIFLKNNLNVLEKVTFDEILFIEVDGNYCLVNTIGRIKYVKKISLVKFLYESFDETFVRIHHKFAINIQHIAKATDTSVELSNGHIIPISKSYKLELN